jgi:hypothetical protein
MNKTQWIRHLRQIAVVVSMVGLSTTALAVPDAPFQSAFTHFLKANAGDAAAIERAAEAFAALLQTEPSNPRPAGLYRRSNGHESHIDLVAVEEDGVCRRWPVAARQGPGHGEPQTRCARTARHTRRSGSQICRRQHLSGGPWIHEPARPGTKLLGDVLNSPLLDSAPLEFKGSVWLKAATVAIDTKNTAEARRYLDLIVQRNAPQAAHAQSLRKGLSS